MEAAPSRRPPKEERPKETGRGVICAVPSGDSVVVSVANPRGPPVEREITLSMCTAPRLGRRQTAAKSASHDEPFAWAARESLRTLAIGKPATFTVDFYNEKNNRAYGYVTLAGDQAVILNEAVVTAGFAKVRPPITGKEPRPEQAELLLLEQTAMEEKRGMWTDDEQAKSTSVRNVPAVAPLKLFDQIKGVKQRAVVEQVVHGSMMRITLIPTFETFLLHLAGVKCFGFKRIKKDKKEDEEDVPAEFVPEGPFAREAKFFSQTHVLHREVDVYLQGIDKLETLFGSVILNGHNLSEELLRAGLASYVEWSAARTAAPAALRAAEKEAQNKRLRLWADYTPPSKSDKTLPKELHGKVTDITNSPGQIVVTDQAGRESKVTLSSVRVPRAGPPVKDETKLSIAERRERALGFEARETLRRLLIGKRVRCVLDYVRPQTTITRGDTQEVLPERAHWTVYQEKLNVGVALVEAGLAEVAKHYEGDARSRDYEELVLAEKRASEKGRGVFGPKDKAPSMRINDLTQDKAKGQAFLPFLKRAGRVRAVVQYEHSGSKVKLFIPKESCQINFVLGGLRVGEPEWATEDEKASKSHSLAAHAFLRNLVHLHDVEVEVTMQDKGGNFVGAMFVNKQNVSAALLGEGLARANTFDEDAHSNELLNAEASAKHAHKGIWHNYDEVVEEEKRQLRREARQESEKPRQEVIKVVITEVMNGKSFFVQVVSDEISELENMMERIRVGDWDTRPHHTPAKDEVCLAKFTADDQWYRAKALRAAAADGTTPVRYIDFGNSETVPASRVRKIDPALLALPAQAHEAALAYITVPGVDEDFGVEAATTLREMVYGKKLMANVEYRDGQVMMLSIGDPTSNLHVNAALVRHGLARVERRREKHLSQLITKLRDEEEKARSSRSNIWQYGDIGSDDEDDRVRK